MAYIDKITAINSSNNTSEVFDVKDTTSGYTTNTGTVTKVTVGSDLKVGNTAGGNITTTGTITHANSVTAKTTQALYPIKYDAQGHITGSGSAITNISAFTNDVGYVTSEDIPEGASAYTGTTSAVGTTASGGTSNGFARGDHVHNITKTTIDSTLGTGSGTTKFYREDGSWATPNYIANTDEKLKIAAVTSGTTYYPVVAANSTAAATRQYDATGLAYAGTNGTTSAVGTAKITLGNSTTSGTANNKKGQITLYGSTAYATTIDPGSPTAARTITLPNKTGTVALTSDIPTISYPVTSVNTKTGAVSLTASDVGAFEKLPYAIGTTEAGIRPYVDQARANRLAFLPADQIIIEKTIDGGTTWTDAGYTDDRKIDIFTENNGRGVDIPLLNNAKSTLCGLRVTITGMKYNVPANTAETSKYNYWSSSYISSVERYFNVREWWFWLSANKDTIRPEIYCATGANPNNWVTVFNSDFGMTGWSGSDWIRSGDGKTFGGGTTQTSNYWNWRIVFWSRYAEGKTSFQSTTAQSIIQIRCYGDSVWNSSNNLMDKDHLYYWDNYKNATFPAKVTLGTAPTANMDAATKKYVDDNIPTKTSDLTNDSGFITSDNKVKQSPIGNSTLRKGVLLSYDSYSGLSNETTNISYVSNRFLFCPGNSSDTVPGLEVLDSSGNKSSRLSYNNVILQNSSNAYRTTVTAGTPTANNTVTLPSATGTVALTSDIPTKVSELTNDSGFITSYTDTKNTAGSTNTSSKIYLIGATSQAANPQTYSHDTAYVGTDGYLYSNSKKTLVEQYSNNGYVLNVTPSVSNSSADFTVQASLDNSGNFYNTLHLGSDGFYISNDIDEKNWIYIDNNGTTPVSIKGIKTPQDQYDAVNKKYVDDHIPTIPDISGKVNITETNNGVTTNIIRNNDTHSLVLSTTSSTESSSLYIEPGQISLSTQTSSLVLAPSEVLINTDPDNGRGPQIHMSESDNTATIKAQSIKLEGLSNKGVYTLAGSATASRTITLPNKTGTVALTSDIPTVPTNISAFTNDAGYITSADVPEGASAYTGTISAVGTTASSGTNNGFARGDHTHNITKTTIDSVLGTGSGTTKYYREDGTWVTPTDTKNTAGSTNTSSKIFLIGATSQAANPQTYSHDTAYVGTDGKLYSASKVVLVGGSNASSSVTITPTTTDVYSMTSAGSVTAGTKASFTRGTFSQGTLPTMTWAMDSTDTKKLNITFSQGTLPTHAADSFTANTPTAVTLPGRSSAIKAWTGYSAATAAAQAFTGVTG